MTNKDLADLIFPEINKTIEDYELMYPPRDLGEGAKVARFAPSPTGYMHIGNFMSALIDYMLVKNSGGVFYLRNEDTDKAREVEGATDKIMGILKKYDIMPTEYEYNGEIVGNYGPYVQSERKDIYKAYVKHLIEIGRAYPCFCSKKELEELRENQEKIKKRTGYYGVYAKCRHLSIEDQIEKIKNGEPYVIRFKSNGDFEKQIWVEDLVKGKLHLSENDIDDVIMKSDNMLPTYHFAHVVDDHLMHTTHVVRGEEWLPSLTKHIEMFMAFGFKPPKYIHIPLIMKQDGENKRKISKRKDPEASMSYYEELGYPEEAVIESIMTIANSNYEEWHKANKDQSFKEFTFSPKKMSASGGLYDLEKLNNLSKEIISRMTKEELYERSYEWSKKYDEELKSLIESDPEYYKNIINIEREQKKPRKDYETYGAIKREIWYMFDSLFVGELNYDFKNITNKDEIALILKTYIEKYYNENDDKETWFNKIKDMCDELGYASDMKAYKNNPDDFKGNIADVTTVIRVALTTSSMTPDLYEILKLFGKDRILKRIEKFYK